MAEPARQTSAAPPGDDAARFEFLVVPEVEVLWRAACAVTGSHHDAEDLVQDTLLRAYRSMGTFDGRHPRAWLLTILRNTNLNTHRRRRPGLLPSGEIPDSASAVGPQCASAEDAAGGQGFDHRVEAALRDLSAKHASVVALVDIAGLTYDEAAAALGIPAGTVMSRLHRARHQLRSRLERYPDLGGPRS